MFQKLKKHTKSPFMKKMLVCKWGCQYKEQSNNHIRRHEEKCKLKKDLKVDPGKKYEVIYELKKHLKVDPGKEKEEGKKSS